MTTSFSPSQTWLLAYLIKTLALLAPVIGTISLYRILYSGTGHLILVPAVGTLIFPIVFFLRSKISLRCQMAIISVFLLVTVLTMAMHKGLNSNLIGITPLLMLTTVIFYSQRGFAFTLIVLIACISWATVDALSAGSLLMELKSDQAILMRGLTHLLIIVVTCIAFRGIYITQNRQEITITDQASTISRQLDTIDNSKKKAIVAERNLQLLENTISCFIFTIRFDGTISFQNRYAITILGEEAGHSSIYEMVADEESERQFRAALNAAKDGQEIARFPAKLITEDGLTSNIIAACAPRMNSSAEPIDMVCAATDITALQKERDRLRNLNKLEAVGLACARIAHDFRNLLTVIQGNLEVLDYSDLNQDARSTVREAMEAVSDSVVLTRQIGEFSSSHNIKPEPTELRNLLNKCASNAAKICPPEINISAETSIDDALVEIDANVLTIIILNLVQNAIDAITSEGQITIHSHLDSANDSTVPSLSILISDNGSGISAANLKKVTDPFFSTKTVNKGLGLGLSTSRGLTEEIGGSLSIDSTEGVGTTVTLTIPAPLVEPDLTSAEG